ncbi:MAG: DUF3696 domain-containing protein [Deltaproteobacteria bacterium]|nr:DUF3696 domain-containing protein [Deltaproteobacteria bacterium]
MIRFVHLRNFKCFEDQAFELRPLTLLSGLNGAGKSSLLQALVLLRQSFKMGLLPSTGLALNGDLVHLGTAHDALFGDAEEEVIEFQLTLEDGTEGRWRFDYDQKADVMNIALGPESTEIFECSLFADNFHYLEAERIGPRTSFEMSDFHVRQHRQLGTRGEYTEHFLSVFGSENIHNKALAHSGSESLKLRDQVEGWMGEVSPGTRIHIDSHPGMDLVSLLYSFETGKQVSNRFRSTNVGFGITYTLPVIVALVSSPPGSLLLFENPEAHLHPMGQVRIGELIALAASCGIQIIVETHSDHVLNGIRLAVYNRRVKPNIVKPHFFERRIVEDQSRISIISPTIDQDGRIDRWPNGFFDVWDKCLEALLKPRDR